MNPFDLPGPQFLAFYAVLGVVVIALLQLLRWQAESGPAPKINCADPYLIAYLRGGDKEALRVATVSLIDRGLLKLEGTEVVTDPAATLDSVRSPIEKALLRKFTHPSEATAIFDDAQLVATCRDYRDTLTRLQLLPDQGVQQARTRRLVLACIILGGVAMVKLGVALQRGRYNIVFLIILALVFIFIAMKIGNPFRTVRGNLLLTDVRTLFAALRARAPSLRPGGATADVAMLAAVFGLAALPTDVFPYTKRLYPKAATSSGSSCGVSCGSSCGSSCGGGGCGGGCGGCGS